MKTKSSQNEPDWNPQGADGVDACANPRAVANRTAQAGSGSDFACESTQMLGGLSPADQQRLSEILDEYLQEIENGRVPDTDQLLAQHPQWAHVLQRYLESLGVLHSAAREIQGTHDTPTIPEALATERRLGDYEIRRQIGRGGMGIVYEARQVSLDRRVALKVLPLAAVLDDKQIARVRREAQAAAQLHHPHIVPVFGVGC